MLLSVTVSGTSLQSEYITCSEQCTEICTVFSVQCKLYSVQCKLYSVQCTVYSVQCTGYRVQCIVYSVQCTVYITPYSIVQCTLLRTVQYSHYTVQFEYRTFSLDSGSLPYRFTGTCTEQIAHNSD